MNDYLHASFLGAARAATLMPLEQPLDYSKTLIQSNFYRGPALRFIVSHYKQHGILKFYTGFSTNLFRTTIKQAYRLPLMIYVPNMYRRVMKNENYIQILTGVSLAVIESYILCPIERVKTWLMTSPEPNFKLFFKYISSLSDLYSGAVALVYRQTLSWVTFLGCTSVLKESVLKRKSSIDYYDLLSISLIVGVINTTVTMPVDFIKTHKQKFRELGNMSVIKSAFYLTQSEILVSNKILLVFCGWRVRLAHYFLNAFATVTLVDYLEKLYSTRYKS